jgi:xylan 1,4-beta-xylosidase
MGLRKHPVLKPLIAAAALLLACLPAVAQSPRVISADYLQVKAPKSTTYRRVINAGRLEEGLRADWQEQLRVCKEAIGFDYLRCHGVLNDELGVYSEDAKGNPVYNWQYIDTVYDFLLSIHVRPFVEIDFMPQAMASIKSDPSVVPAAQLAHTKIVVPSFWWRANMTAPKSWPKWEALVKALVQHWTDRYGAEEVSQWCFEVWNEPDYPTFFIPVHEEQRGNEYYTLYQHTAAAVKAVNAKYRVGGPATAYTTWISGFINACYNNKVPLDFLSFHAYGIAEGAMAFDAKGNKRLYLDPNLDAVADKIHWQDGVIADSPMPHLPVHITEWSPSYSNNDPIHDSYFAAPYILNQLKQTEGLASMAYWTFTDIIEELGPPKLPYEGAYGLINLQGIKKPAFFAYQFLNQLGDQELTNSDPRSWVCRDDKGGVQALIFDLTDPRGKSQDQDPIVFGKQLIPNPKPPVQLTLSSIPPGNYHLSIYRIGYNENDPYSAYLKMGAPTQLSIAQVKQLKSLAAGAPSEESDISISTSGKWQHDVAMHDNEVVLVTLVPR